MPAARDLAPGTVVGDDDLVVVHVRVSSGEYVPQSDAVVGRVLNRTIGEGELVPASALVDADGYSARAIAVESAMPLADGVGVGSLVDVWVTVQDDTGSHSTLVGSALPVTDVREAKSSLGSRGRADRVRGGAVDGRRQGAGRGVVRRRGRHRGGGGLRLT